MDTIPTPSELAGISRRGLAKIERERRKREIEDQKEAARYVVRIRKLLTDHVVDCAKRGHPCAEVWWGYWLPGATPKHPYQLLRHENPKEYDIMLALAKEYESAGYAIESIQRAIRVHIPTDENE